MPPNIDPETAPPKSSSPGSPLPVPAGQKPDTSRKGPADQPSGLTMFFMNIVMIVVIGCLTIGIEFALYSALILAPIWLVAITLLVVFAADPDASLSE